MCNKDKWSGVNQFLLDKNWEYYESKKGDSDHYSTITWSFNKSYEDKANAWFYLYAYDDTPSKINYSVFNKSSYNIIQKALSSNGYKLLDSEILDDKIISKYENATFYLKISTIKTKKDNVFDESTTAYSFTLTKKAGAYDSDNGKKIEYYYDDVKQKEYTLLNGKFHGEFKEYHENGKIKKVLNYVNDAINGKVHLYNELGLITQEFSMVNDKLSGLSTTYYYDDNKLNAKQIGNYINEKKDGVWRTVIVEENKTERTLVKYKYVNGIKNGLAQDIQGDSLILSNYLDDQLNGNYHIYIDLTTLIFGGVMATDTSKLQLKTNGTYKNDLKTGFWKYYSITGNIKSEGSYVNDKKYGEWRYYHDTYVKNDDHLPYSQKLFLIKNYENDELNGISTRYSYLKKENYKCENLNKNNMPKDSCSRMVYEKVLETSTYRNGKLNGQIVFKDSLNKTWVEGNFENDLKDGLWKFTYTKLDKNNNPIRTYQKGYYIKDKSEGEWIEYINDGRILKTMNYKNDEFDGDYIEYNENEKQNSFKKFNNGKLQSLVVYDESGSYPIKKYDLSIESSTSYKCNYTIYQKGGRISQEYLVKKQEDFTNNYEGLEFLFELALDSNDPLKIYKDGEYSEFDIIGNILVKGNYRNNKKISFWSYYFPDQNVRMEVNNNLQKEYDEKYFTLNNSLYSGDFILTNESSNTKEVISIKNGLRHGKTEIIDLSSGKSIKKIKYKYGLLN
tara:strand:+ start:124593 stop:126782 length:2190 start_codon:yes stop_codon:yes gene_type:complete